MLGDIKLGENLDPRNHGGMKLASRSKHFAQVTVYTVPNQRGLLTGFDMDIAGFLSNRVNDNVIHQIDDRTSVGE